MFLHGYLLACEISTVRIQTLTRCVMGCHATTRGSITSGDGVKTERHVLHKGQ